MEHKLIKITIENTLLVGTMGFLKDMISSYQKKFENVKSSDESIWNIWMSRRN